MHARTHTTSAFFVSRPDKKQSNTQTTHTRVPYGMSASCMKLLTFFLTSFFFLSSSFLFFSSLIWARRCFLRSSSAFRSLLSDMASYWASREEEDRTGMSYVWQCHHVPRSHCYMISYRGAQVYPGSFSDASQSLLGVADTKTWYWQNCCWYQATLSREGLSHWHVTWMSIPAELVQCMWAIFRRPLLLLFTSLVDQDSCQILPKCERTVERWHIELNIELNTSVINSEDNWA